MVKWRGTLSFWKDSGYGPVVIDGYFLKDYLRKPDIEYTCDAGIMDKKYLPEVISRDLNKW